MMFLIQAAVFLLMVSIGMSIRPRELIPHWRQIGAGTWASLLLATFIIPPTLALLIAKVLHLTGPETGGLFLVGAAPGAPLLTRNLAKKGFDMHLAASYQVWAALMVPIMIPLVVLVAGKLYGRDIWIPPRELLWQIVLKQLLPATIGVLIVAVAPVFAERSQAATNLLGNLLLTVVMAAVLWKLGMSLRSVSPLVPLGALLLASGSIAAVLVMQIRDPLIKHTFAICNANRHSGLALLLAGQYLHTQEALPVVACYALLAPVVMVVYVRQVRQRIAVTA